MKRLKTSKPTGGSRVPMLVSYSCTKIILLLVSSCLEKSTDVPEASFIQMGYVFYLFALVF